MRFFNSIAFNVSLFYFLISILQQISYYLFCKKWNIGMISFAVFNSPKFSLAKKKIGSTEYKLGWLPLGIYIELLGADKDSYEKLSEADKRFALLSKPNWQRSVFKLIPFIVILLYLLISGILSNNIILFYSDMSEMIVKSIKTMFGFESYEDTGSLATKIIQLYGLYPFIFFTGAVLFLSAKIMDLFSQLFFGTERPLILKITGFLYLIFMLWFMLWKMPSFFLHYFLVSDILIAAASYLSGVILSGIIFYLLVISLIKPRN